MIFRRPKVGQEVGYGHIAYVPGESSDIECHPPGFCFLRGLNVEGLIWQCSCGQQWKRTSDYVVDPDYRWVKLDSLWKDKK